MMLCAAWELFAEELVVETAEWLVHRATNPFDLPLQCQQAFSNRLRAHQHDLHILNIAGDGWKEEYVEEVKRQVARLNSPTSQNISDLFSRWTGKENIIDCWTTGAADLDAFVSVRGEIAHRGGDAIYPTLNDINMYRNQICLTVEETDREMATHIADVMGGRVPWRRT